MYPRPSIQPPPPIEQELRSNNVSHLHRTTYVTGRSIRINMDRILDIHKVLWKKVGVKYMISVQIKKLILLQEKMPSVAQFFRSVNFMCTGQNVILCPVAYHSVYFTILFLIFYHTVELDIKNHNLWPTKVCKIQNKNENFNFFRVLGQPVFYL